MKNDETFVFSKPKIVKYFMDYAEWLLIGLIFLIFFAGLTSNNLAVSRVIYGTLFFGIILTLITVLVVFYHKKTAYKIIFDFKNDTVYFHMTRKQGVLAKRISNIEKIIINFRITFLVNGQKIKYQEDNIKNELSAFLDKNFEVESGIFRHLPFPFK